MDHPVQNSPGSVDVCALLVNSIDRGLSTYRRELNRCKKQYSEEAVHDLRVATRRLISTLDILGSIVSDNRFRKARRRLKKRLDMFDSLRDTQVLLLYLSELLPVFPQLQAFHDALMKQERRLMKRIGKKLRRVKTGKLQKSLTAMMRELHTLFQDQTAQHEHSLTLIGTLGAAFAAVVDRRHSIDPANTATIHRMRVAFKKFRYMAEVLHPLVADIGDEQLIHMHTFQTMMGNIQDVEVLLASLKTFSLKKKAGNGESLLPVQQELLRRLTILIDTFLSSADDLFTFWKPA